MITIETTTNKNTEQEQYTVFYCGEPVASFSTRAEAEAHAAIEQDEMAKVEAEIEELNSVDEQITITEGNTGFKYLLADVLAEAIKQEYFETPEDQGYDSQRVMWLYNEQADTWEWRA